MQPCLCMGICLLISRLRFQSYLLLLLTLSRLTATDSSLFRGRADTPLCRYLFPSFMILSQMISKTIGKIPLLVKLFQKDRIQSIQNNHCRNNRQYKSAIPFKPAGHFKTFSLIGFLTVIIKSPAGFADTKQRIY